MPEACFPVENFPTIIGTRTHQKILAGLSLAQQPLLFQSDIVKPYSMATLFSVAKSSDLGLGGAKPGGWPRALLFLRHASYFYVQSEGDALLWLRALFMMLKPMMIIIAKAIAIAGGCCGSGSVGTNRVLATNTNRLLWLNNR